ncbi:DUF1205 domain-containing protein [Dactylosporangium aurantiacum]|uniref:DUF1205 domain-containing protein n=1 Tax=Dactylosporangium aurantiacum TaxID=35754 RepID=A0A9Q9IBZ8_9ACTN|nr:nucleotide disphospho-sugar-binding domain-containing protein [Dactylosporangium aurantiacum]MDG6101825.1 DUF1205 domain-containing protein [Dactylosporangium aurantiacum]UWZ52371.1 DUF1205 domain-containing protein [Dactylosporangium aurantiacum]
MRILFVTAAGAHVPWIVPLSWASQLAGHEVRVAVRPMGVDAVRGTGLVTVPLGDEATIQRAQSRHQGLAYRGTPRNLPGNWFADPGLLDKDLRVNMALRLLAAAEGAAADAVALAESWRPDLVVYDTVASVGLVVAAAAGVPAVGHTFGYSFGFDYQGEEELWTAYRRLFEPHGLDPVFPQFLVDPCPPALRDPHRIPWAPMRLIAYNGPVVAEDWLTRRGTGPRVCITSGMTSTLLDGVVARIVDGAEKLGAEVVLAVDHRDRATVAERPPTVRVVESYPLSVLAPTCDVVVHHSGVGTGMITAISGVPQVVLPQSTSQDFWADKVERAGAGVAVRDVEHADPDVIRDAVETVLNDASYREGAEAIRRGNAAMPTPATIVGLLEDCAAGADVRSSPLLRTA